MSDPKEPKSLLTLCLQGLLEDRGQLRIPLPVGRTWHQASKDLEVARYLSPELSIQTEERAGRWWLVVSKPGRLQVPYDA